MAVGAWWATMTGHRFTDAGDSLSVDVATWATYADEDGIASVTFTINGGDTVVTDRTLRTPNYNAQPSPRTTGGQMADLAAFGVTINAADYAAGTITITAEAETGNGTTQALPGSVIIYNDKGGADTRPSPKTRYANADTGDDANDGTSSGSAVRTIQRLCEVMSTAGDIGGALGICEAATAHYEMGGQTALDTDLFTTGHWWGTVRLNEGAVFERTGTYDPGSNGPALAASGVLLLRGGDVRFKLEFAGTNGEPQQVGGNPFVLSGAYEVHLWTEGGVIGNDHWDASTNLYSVRHGEKGWGLIYNYGPATSTTRYVTCCTLRGINNGFVGVDFVHDCHVEYWQGWAMQTDGSNPTPCVLNSWFPHQRYDANINGYLDCRIGGKVELVKLNPTTMRMRVLSGQTLTFQAQGAGGPGGLTTIPVDLRRHGQELAASLRWGIRLDNLPDAGNNSPAVGAGAAFPVVGYGVDGRDGYYLDYTNPSGVTARVATTGTPTVATARKDISSGGAAAGYYTDLNHPDLCQFLGGFTSLLYQGLGAPDCTGTRVWAFSGSTYQNFFLVNCGDHFTDQLSDVYNIAGGMVLHCSVQSGFNLSGSFSGFEIRKSAFNNVSGNPGGITWDGNHFINGGTIGTNASSGAFYVEPPYPSGEMRPLPAWHGTAPDDGVWHPSKYAWPASGLPTPGVWLDVGIDTQLEAAGATATAAGTFPALTGSGEAVQGTTGAAAGTFPALSASGEGGNIASGEATGTFPAMTASGTAFVVGQVAAAGSFPALRAAGQAEQDNGMVNNVPGILYIGGYMVQGGGGSGSGLNAEYTTESGLPDTTLKYLGDRDIMRIVPDITSGATAGDDASGTAQCWPWYDGRAGSFLTITSSTRTTLTVSGAGWTADEWISRSLTVPDYAYALAPDTGFRFEVTVTDNDTDTLTVAAWGATVAATTTVSGLRYEIVSAGTTDFTAVGAADSNVGTVFTATGAATGTGTVVEIPKPGERFFLGEGRFDAYHASRAFRRTSEVLADVPSFRGGDSWQTGGLGVGPTCTMIRRLLEDVYPSSPYFHFVKWGSSAKVISGWGNSPNDSARASFLAEMERVTAAASSRGNTISWDHAILDSSMEDVKYARLDPANIAEEYFYYPIRLREQIAWLRSSAVMNNPNAVITLVNHDPYMYAGTPGFVQQMRIFHQQIAREDGNIRILDMAGQPFGKPTDVPSAEWITYSQPGFMEYGRKAAEVIRVANLGLNQNITAGFPVYLMLGDSIFVGEINSGWTTELSSPTLSEGRPAAQKVYNRGSVALEIYSPHNNSNTSGTVGTKAGPELSLMHELYELHPDGFALIKRASYGSALATEAAAYGTDGVSGGTWTPATPGEHWDEMKADLASCLSLVSATLNKTGDLVGAFVSLGHNDCATAGGGAAFATGLPVFCYALWELATRSSGPKFPIIWRRPQSDAGSIPADEVAAVRAAIETFSAQETQFEYIDVDDLERKASASGNDPHETPESAVIDGERLVAKLRTRSLAVS